MQEFYASIKLKNGEEMLTIVTETCPEEDYIKVKNPIGVEELDIPGIIQGLKIKLWMKLAHKDEFIIFLLYTSPSPRDSDTSRMPSSA